MAPADTYTPRARRTFPSLTVWHCEKKDVNDDGYSDVIVSAYGANEAYVFYGASTFSSSSYELNTLSGIDGFVVSTGSDGDALVVAAAGVRLTQLLTQEKKTSHFLTLNSFVPEFSCVSQKGRCSK